MLLRDIGTPELWAFGLGTLILLLALIYGAVRAGWLSPQEKARTDAATLDMQRRARSAEDNRPRR